MKLRTAGATLCAMALMGANASAATLKVEDSTFTYTGSPGEASNLVVTTAGNTITFTESAGVIVVMPDASALNRAVASCPVPLGVSVTCTFDNAQTASAIFNLGDGNDRISFEGTTALTKLVKGEDGDDVLGGGSGLGGELVGGKGADTFVANPGSTVSYRGSTSPVFVTVDGVADDGVDGERDNVRVGFTHFVLGASSDEFSGSGVSETIVGGGGVDAIFGAGGNDTITGSGRFSGGSGNDHLTTGNRHGDLLIGGSGDDYLSAGLGADTLDGGDGADDLFPSEGADTVLAGAGNDYVRVPKDGLEDRIDCGDDDDHAQWTSLRESNDVYEANCETITGT